MNQPNHPGYPQAPGQAPPAGYPPQGVAPGQMPQQAAPGGYPPQQHPSGHPVTAQVPQVPGGVGYEFTEQENVTVERAAAWAKGLGLLLFVQCVLQMINLNVIGIVLNLALGVLFWRGGAALSNVVTTQGNDVQHLLEALQQLGQALLIRIIAVSVGAAILLIVGVIAAIAMLA